MSYLSDEAWKLKTDLIRERMEKIQNSGLPAAQKAVVYGSEFLGPKEQLDIEETFHAMDPESEENQVTALVKKLKTQAEAERRIAGENYSGSKAISWEEMREHKATFIIEDLVPDDAVVFTVARANLGKTFSYIDAMCRMAAGMDWLGKKTRQAKTLVVLGEGRNGFIDRLDAWREAHGVDEAVLREWIRFIDGANLANDASLDLLKEAAEDHQAELIILDTWSVTSGATKEEDNGLNSELLRRARTIRDGATLWGIHHPRKAEEDTDAPVMRGAGALYGRAEVVMTMWKDRTFTGSNGAEREWLAISTEGDHKGKNRVGATETIRGLYLSEDFTNPVFTQELGQSLSRKATKTLKLVTRTMTVKEYQAKAGCAENTARDHLTAGVNEGVLRRLPGTGNTPDKYEPTNPFDHALAALAEAKAGRR